jgi:hypothetical protein
MQKLCVSSRLTLTYREPLLQRSGRAVALPGFRVINLDATAVNVALPAIGRTRGTYARGGLSPVAGEA